MVFSGGENRWPRDRENKMNRIDDTRSFIPVGIAVLTVSDTRTLADDKSGDTLVARIAEAGHELKARAIVPDDKDRIAGQVREWTLDPDIDVVITTGGTGFTGRDVTPGSAGTAVRKAHGRLFGSVSPDFLRQDRHLDDPVAGDRRGGERHLHLRAAGFARRLQGRLGRHPESAARLPPHALQFHRDHAAARRAPEARRQIGVYRTAAATQAGIISLASFDTFWPRASASRSIPDFASAIACRFGSNMPYSSGGTVRPIRLKNGRR